MLAKKGTFTRKTDGTGNQSVTGLRFKPKFVFVWYTRQTAFDSSGSGYEAGWGMAAGTTQQFCIAAAAQDNVNPTNFGKGSASGLVRVFSDAVPTLESAGELASFDNDGFTVNWTTNPDPATAIQVHYLALGGLELQVFIGEFTGPAAADPAAAFTGVGFRGSFALFLTTNQTAKADTTGFSVGFGAAASAAKQMAVSTAGNDAAGALQICEVLQTSSNCLVSYKHGAVAGNLAVDNSADLVTFDTDGFTMDFSPVTTANVLFWAAVFRDSGAGQNKFDVTAFQDPAGTGNQAYTGVGFKPVAALFVCMNFSGLDVEQTGSRVNLGGADAVSQGATSAAERNVLASDAWQRTTTASAGLSVGATGAVENEFALVSFDTDGFTLNWTVVDLNDRNWGISFGGEEPPAGNPHAAI